MSDTAPEIKVTLTAEDKGVAAAIKELGNQLSALKAKQQEVADSSLNLKKAFDAVISSAIILKVIEFGKQTFEASLNLDRLAQKTGLSAGFLSTFAKAAEGSGVSTEQVSTSLGRLATNITKFQQGGTQAAAAMKALGISQTNLKNLSPEQAIRLVTDRLGSMHDGLQKAAIAQTLMGRGGQALLPTLNALAGDGFDKVADAATRSGQAITEDMAANTLAAAAAMNELEGAARGAATQFEAGLEPAIIEIGEALSKSLESDGAKGFTALGEKAATALRYVALLFLELGTTVGGFVATVTEAFDQMWNAIKLGGETVAAALNAGSFKGAWDVLKQGSRDAVKQSEDDAGRMRAIWETTGDQIVKNFKQLIPSDDEEKKRQAERNAKFKPKGGNEPPPEDNNANKAKLAALLARLQAELALYKANNSAEEAANQEAYNEGLESTQAFFARKKQLAQAESDEQISILRRERAATAAAPTDGTDAGETEKRAKLTKLDSEIAVAKVNATKTQGELDSQLFLAQQSHAKALAGFQTEILKAQGLTYAAALSQIQGEAAEIQKSLVQAGLSPGQVAALLAQIQQLKLSTAAFSEDKRQAEQGLVSLSAAKDDINLQVTAGLETQYGAEQRIAQLELQRIPELERIAAAMKAAAITPEQIQEADQFAQKLKSIQVNATATAAQMKSFAKQAGAAVESDLNTFLTQTIFQAKGIGNAFRQLAGSVVGSIQKIVTGLLLQIVTTKLLKAITHQDDGATGVAAATAKGIAQATPLITAASEMTASGVAITSGATALGVSAGILQAAADTLIIANAAGGGVGHAVGGYIRGPGTSTSDSIPARLSDGEFVMSARAVDKIGVHNLATMNMGLSVPSASGMAVAHFAEGGLVQGGAGGGPMDLHLGIGLDEGLILKHLGSKQAGKVVLRHLAANPKAANKAISRGQ